MRNRPTYIIAEAGVNHNGSLEIAMQLVDVAADAGADAVKFQTFKAGKLVSQCARKANYQIENTGEAESQLEMVRKLELGEVEHRQLVDKCKSRHIDFLSTPFDEESLRFLVEEIGLSRIKVPSGEITNAPFLLEIARTGKQVILSTGMSTLGEVEQALAVLAYGFLTPSGNPAEIDLMKAYQSQAGRRILTERVTVLHCTTEYPTDLADVNLQAMESLSAAFQLPVGYSDHTEGIVVPLAAAARGAVILEKHFTLDRTMPGPDHRASLEPDELLQMVQSVRAVEKALGSSTKAPTAGEIDNRMVARRSIVATCDIACGEAFTVANLCLKRPGNGISPFRYWDLLGKRAQRDYSADEVLTEDLVGRGEDGLP